MILALRCNQPRFREVVFGPGLNVVLAERTREESGRQSRNGLGKSTLIELLHFCLGGSYKGPITASALHGWEFSLDLLLGGEPVTITRSTAAPKQVVVAGNAANWPIQPKRNGETGALELGVDDWTALLGARMFGLPVQPADKYQPAFRGLISYFIRRGKDAYLRPFEFRRAQKAWQVQVLDAFLLGLGTRDAVDFQLLKDRQDTLRQLKKLIGGTGTAREFLGTLGENEARKVQLEMQARTEEAELREFRVHPQYQDIARRADELTRRIHDLANDNVTDRRLAEMYRQTLSEERAPESPDVAAIYRRAEVDLPATVKKRLEDVQQFHRKLVANRKSFLSSEIERLVAVVESRDSQMAELTAERAELMSILESHGALEEYTRLQQRHLKTRAELESVVERIKRLRELRQGEGALKIDQAALQDRALRGLDELAQVRDAAIERFNANSLALYESPGNLVVDVDANGFRFDVEIQRSSSDGVGNMKIFCFDLMLAQTWSRRPERPGFLVHDSVIFDGVDERQRARALELAARESERFGFQYICAINSDAVPYAEFTPGFDFARYVRLSLSDRNDESRLMGMRFEVERARASREEEDGEGGA